MSDIDVKNVGEDELDSETLKREMEELYKKFQSLVDSGEQKLVETNHGPKRSRSSDDQALLTAVQGGADRAPYYDTINSTDSAEQAVVGETKVEVVEDVRIEVIAEDGVQAQPELSESTLEKSRHRVRLRYISGLTVVFIIVLVIAGTVDSKHIEKKDQCLKAFPIDF